MSAVDVTQETYSKLLPAVRAFAQENPELGLDIEVHEDNLLVTGRNEQHPEGLGFAVTKAAIADGLVESTFKPNMEALIKVLRGEANG